MAVNIEDLDIKGLAKHTPDEILAIMQSGLTHSMTPTGLMRFASFMRRIGMIKTVPASWRDYAFEHLHGLPGN